MIRKLTNRLYCDAFKIKLAKRDFDAKAKRKAMASIAIKDLEQLDNSEPKIYLCGVPMHTNMGDQAQCFCIKQWCKANYPDRDIVLLPTWPFYEKNFREILIDKVKVEDIFVIQSGYCTSERHFDHKMHRFIAENFTGNKILIMPQTVNFFDDREANKTGRIFAMNKNILFLARDKKSFELAKKYFENTNIQLYPDIVTSLIGSRNIVNDRDGVLVCVRNDAEKKYTTAEINTLVERFVSNGYHCEINDTNSELAINELVSSFEGELDRIISFFAKHKVIITDRYHGTIFSLISNTPVIVLETIDHKVKTGTEWFDGVYDGAYYNANSLEAAYDKACEILGENIEINNKPYFKHNYFDKLKEEFNKI